MSTAEAAPLAAQRRRARHRARFGRTWWNVVSIALLAVVWQIVSMLVGPTYLPSFTAVIGRLVELIVSGAILPSLVASLTNLAVGLVVSVVLGVLIGALMGVSWRVEAALDLYVNILLVTPTLVFAPILFALFGIGRAVLIILVVMFALVYIIINTADAVKTVSSQLVEMASTFGATRWQIVTKIVLPACVPMMMAGFMVAVPRGVKGMITGEMFLAATGLGAIVIAAGKQFDAETVLAMLVFIVIIAFTLLGLFGMLEQRVHQWLPTPTQSR
jgi:NitT/TauT family transport system permease protein